ncbi:hypothetical protein J40TS1_04610 [Paenibacillus montaniterrae]|uniref:Uncharacterized protein n=1 Tax=Paenibacillus montaniterrae TaxID=429341 RepID=A0A919YMJ9_9BACL|nr:hypothetical protein J40TS1_04610 [Paenibacillus montaniterrae]
MNLDKFLVLVCPLLVIVISIGLLIFWGAFGNTDEKPERK